MSDLSFHSESVSSSNEHLVKSLTLKVNGAYWLKNWRRDILIKDVHETYEQKWELYGDIVPIVQRKWVSNL